MQNIAIRRGWQLSLLALALFTMTGCAPKLDGKYEDKQGIMSVEFKSGKAYVNTLGGETEVEYEVNGDKITLKNQAANVVLTRNSDGSLEGPMGKMTRK